LKGGTPACCIAGQVGFGLNGKGVCPVICGGHDCMCGNWGWGEKLATGWLADTHMGDWGVIASSWMEEMGIKLERVETTGMGLW